MNLFLTYNYNQAIKAILKEKLDELGIDYDIVSTNEVIFKNELTAELKLKLEESLTKYGITIKGDKNMDIVARIKSAINDMLSSDAVRLYNTSDYLSKKLNYIYTYLSTLFSETTYSSIENYIILSKVDKAKEMLLKTDYTLTEIAYRLNYSSVAHLSRQFKKTTGLTPSTFQRIIAKRKEQLVK